MFTLYYQVHRQLAHHHYYTGEYSVHVTNYEESGRGLIHYVDVYVMVVWAHVYQYARMRRDYPPLVHRMTWFNRDRYVCWGRPTGASGIVLTRCA